MSTVTKVSDAVEQAPAKILTNKPLTVLETLRLRKTNLLAEQHLLPPSYVEDGKQAIARVTDAINAELLRIESEKAQVFETSVIASVSNSLRTKHAKLTNVADDFEQTVFLTIQYSGKTVTVTPTPSGKVTKSASKEITQGTRNVTIETWVHKATGKMLKGESAAAVARQANLFAEGANNKKRIESKGWSLASTETKVVLKANDEQK